MTREEDGGGDPRYCKVYYIYSGNGHQWIKFKLFAGGHDAIILYIY